jgi:hypothetical protein
MRYGFVAHHAGNEIIPITRGKQRLYYNDGALLVVTEPQTDKN